MKEIIYDYVIILKNKKTNKQFVKGYSSPYLFRKALKKYRFSKNLEIVSYISNSY